MKENEKNVLLQKPLEQFKPSKPVETFKQIAHNLMNNYCIRCWEKDYYFAEIEFYYYKEGEFEGPLYNCTYPRTRNVGKFFWHYSGMDICFESSEEKKYFGGILIRSIKRGSEIIAGPMRCSDEIMNSCDGELPYLVYCETACETPVSTIRYGIEADKNQNMKFCFYIEPETWNRKREGVLVADKATGRYKNVSKTDYYIAEPKKR